MCGTRSLGCGSGGFDSSLRLSSDWRGGGSAIWGVEELGVNRLPSPLSVSLNGVLGNQSPQLTVLV